MRLPVKAGIAGILLQIGLSAQEGPGLFQLWLPDFFETPFTGANTLVGLPDRPIRHLKILVREAQQRNLTPGRYKIFVNGKGLGNVFEERAVPEGTMLVMEPETLRKRTDDLFDSQENAIEISAEDKRGRRYYQNWVLRVNSFMQNSFFGYSSTLSPDDPKSVPPDLVLTEPVRPLVFKSPQSLETITLAGRLSSGATLKVNGKIVAEPKLGATEFQVKTQMPPASRELIVEAVNEKGSSRRIIIPVHRPASNTPLTRFAGKKYAVIIGVTEFGTAKQSPPPLKLAAAGAELFAQRLEKEAGFNKENIRLLMDQKANLEQVRVAFSDFAAKAQSNDILVIYIATHGLHDPRPNKADRMYLAVNGTQLETLDSTALSFSDLEMYLNRSVRTNNCFLLFDVGHELSEEWRFRAGRSLVNNHVLNLFNDKPGWSVLVSGSSDETSKAHEGTSTMFSHWLADALGGAADLNGDRIVSAQELFSFVAENVKLESKGTQQPRFRLSKDGGKQPLAAP